MNQKVEQTIVGIIVILLVLTGIWAYFYHDESDSEVVMGDLTPEELQGGQFNNLTLTLESRSPARLYLNTSVFAPAAMGNYSHQYFDVDNGHLEFEVLVSPVARSVRFIVEQEGLVGVSDHEVLAGDEPLVTGQEVYDWETLLTDSNRCGLNPLECYNGRWVGSGSLTLENFVRDSQTWLEQAGMDEVYIKRYPDQGDAVDVIAKRYGANGSATKEWVVIGGHMDHAPPVGGGVIYGTWEGAYDNTAGVSHILTLARAVGQWHPEKTVVLAFWSGEEEGAYGSEAWVNDPSEVPADVDIQLYFNLDMLGVNWPGVNEGGRLAGYPDGAPYLFRGFVAPDLDEEIIEHPAALELMRHTAHRFLDIPENVTEIQLIEHPRARSDHANFWDLGVTTYKYFGVVDEYDEYHTVGDTLDHMEEIMGGQEMLIRSFDYWMWLVYMNLRFNDVSDDIHREGFGGS